MHECSNAKLIIEGLMTSLNEDGTVNLSPMGSQIDSTNEQICFRPFKTARSYGNVMRTKQAVFHVTDDANLIARAAVGGVAPLPLMIPLNNGSAFRLADTCRWYLLDLLEVDQDSERASLVMGIQSHGTVRDFVGFNRAKHAVIEAAILATRVGILPDDTILRQLEMLHPWIEKTGGPDEFCAYDFLSSHIHESLGVKN